jgi:hypothetical protein
LSVEPIVAAKSLLSVDSDIMGVRMETIANPAALEADLVQGGNARCLKE